MLMEISFSLKQLPGIIDEFWKEAMNTRVIAFHGLLGSGKTTFIHALCDFLGVTDTISSPTFSLINEYSFPGDGGSKKIFHIDLYRLKNEQEAVQAGVEDCLYSDHLCLVEWPEKIPSLLPKDTIHVYLEALNDETRKLKIGDN